MVKNINILWRGFVKFILIGFALTAIVVIVEVLLATNERKRNPPISEVASSSLPVAACKNSLTVSDYNGFTAGLDVPDRARVNLVRAVAIDPFKYIPMTQLEMFHLNEDAPFLWMTPDRKEAVVDQRFFSDLKVVEVVGGLKEEVQIGTATPELLRRMPPAIIARFLLQSEIIRTYWHLKAELCPTAETQTADLYEQRFFATHTYCTNECLVKPYTFTIRINKHTDAITVR